jgi:hypothetical protein
MGSIAAYSDIEVAAENASAEKGPVFDLLTGRMPAAEEN